MIGNSKFSLILLPIITGIFVSTSFASNAPSLFFSRISTDAGLSQSTVFSITQDKQGAMWFATFDGINKYDGYSFTVYRNDPHSLSSIADDMTRVVKTDRRNRIWIGTRKGLSCYDRGNDCFKNFEYFVNHENIQINAIEEIAQDTLLLGTNRGIILFDSEKMVFIPPFIACSPCFCILNTDKQIYLGTDDGLLLYDFEKQQTFPVFPCLNGIRIQSILLQTPDKLWIATEGKGLYSIILKTNRIKNYRHIPNDPHSLANDCVRTLTLDAEGKLWIGTLTGLNIYQDSTDAFDSYFHDPTDNYSLSQNSIRALFTDNQNGMWVGTYFGGLNYYHELKNRFRHIRQIPRQNSLNDNVISCIVEDENHNLWIGTNDKGINFYDAASRRFHYYTLQTKNHSPGLSSNNIKAIYIDEETDRAYIGTHGGGLNVVDRKSGQITHFTRENSSLNDRSIYAILPWENHTLLLGALNGLTVFDPRTSSFTPTLTLPPKNGNNRITVLFKDSSKRLWIGGENGLSVYQPEASSERFTRQNVFDSAILSDAFIHCIIERAPGEIWIGTRQGLFLVNTKNRQTKHYTTQNGLPNNVVYGILTDLEQRLWLSTNNGISRFSPDTETFRNFTQTDGLQNKQFNNYSYCKRSNGEMMFGGINGITAFFPEHLNDNPYTPPAVINELKVSGQPVRPNDATKILDKAIDQTSSITLRASQSAFSIGFVVSNYLSGQHDTFKYRLKGYDKEWHASKEHTASYANLPAGTYTFQVKAANNNGSWNPIPTELKIRILPVWYKSWWAIILFCIFGITLILFFLRHIWLRKVMMDKINLERLEKRHQEEIYRTKMRFFIHVSHELRTPLTLMVAPLQELQEKTTDPWTQKQLRYLKRNTDRLLRLVNQLLDFKRAESGTLKLQIVRGNIDPIVREHFTNFEQSARQKNIDYRYDSEIGKQEHLFDRYYIETILNNLLSNAFKFTETGGNITLRVADANDQLVIEISDTGIGIPIDQQKHIFDYFYQTDDARSGSGIGLALVSKLVELHKGEITLKSIPGQGSTFTVRLPQNESAYRTEEMKSVSTAAFSSCPVLPEIRETSLQEFPNPNDTRSRPKILLVEDNPEILQYLSEGLSPFFQTFQAANGQEGLDILHGNDRIDLIVTDIMMPVMDGIQMCQKIKQDITVCHIPVIMLSAKIDIKDQLEGLQVGADDYIPKPFTIAVLTAKIRNMFQTRKRLQEYYARHLDVEPGQIAGNVMDETLLKRAVSIVEENMDNSSFSVDEFAQAMNMSRSNLHLKLKAITGEPATAFIRKIRLRKACRLLQEGVYSVSEISTMVGFGTPAYFTTCFKKHIGCLPTEYVKKRSDRYDSEIPTE